MTIYRFDKFVFDTDRYELRASHKLIALRPKTAVLMAVLIEQRQQISGKQALFSQVWHSDHVQHQSLFQAISEVRKTLAPLQPIKTHPNLGYQWVAPVKKLSKKPGTARWPGRWAVAVLPIAVVSTLMVWNWQNTQFEKDTPSSSLNSQSLLQSPAMRAFSSGLEEMNNQRLPEARDFFELAERENPLFLEASMMRAEILFQQGNYVEAESLANELLTLALAQGEHYIEVSTQGLLSRISEKSGHWNTALDWALKADDNARVQGFACVAENTRIRIAGLLSETDLSVKQTRISNDDQATGSSVRGEEVLANEYPDASHCQSLLEPSESEPEAGKSDLSQCLDIGTDSQRLALYKERHVLNHRWV